MAGQEFDEEEIWAIVKGRNDESVNTGRFTASRDHYSRAPAGSRMIVIPASSADHEASSRRGYTPHSAPVNVPDWSKIYKKGSSEARNFTAREDGSDGDDEDGDRVPPHVWIAKKLERSKISSSSVCEGAGRTLKGRDLSKVRNAVLTRTGFLE